MSDEILELLERPRNVTLWQCRACGTLNDFEGVELAIQVEREAGDGFLMLANYICAGCAFTLEMPPMWFVTPQGEEPTFIESGFRPITISEVSR